MLVVFSGLPGVGKSAIAGRLAERLGAPVFSVDPIEAAIWRGGVVPSFETGVAAYEVAAVLAEHQLRLGLPVVVDAVNAVEVARRSWRAVADRTGTDLSFVEVVCSDRDLHRVRLTERIRDIGGFPEPTWDEVCQRREEWEPWTDDRLVVDTVGGLTEIVAQVWSYIHDDRSGVR